MPDAGGSEVALPPVHRLRQFDTVRLIPSRFSDASDSVLRELAQDDQHLQDLFDLDNATNQRLIGEFGGLPGIGVDSWFLESRIFGSSMRHSPILARRAAGSTT